MSKTLLIRDEEVASSCVANTTNINPYSVTHKASDEVFDFINPFSLLHNGNQEVNNDGGKLVGREVDNKDRPLEPWIDKKTVTVVKHFCEPIAVTNNGKICTP